MKTPILFLAAAFLPVHALAAGAVVPDEAGVAGALVMGCDPHLNFYIIFTPSAVECPKLDAISY
jgi:hypothetical protein